MSLSVCERATSDRAAGATIGGVERVKRERGGLRSGCEEQQVESRVARIWGDEFPCVVLQRRRRRRGQERREEVSPGGEGGGVERFGDVRPVGTCRR